MAIDALILLLRVVVLVDRKPEVEIENCFYYELAPYPTALFKDCVMRTAKDKSTLKNVLLEVVKPTENTESKIFADGGALFWLCNWRKGEQCSKIFDLNIDKCRKFNINTVVFDGLYPSNTTILNFLHLSIYKSTKDATHKKRSNKMCQVVEIRDGNASPQIEQSF